MDFVARNAGFSGANDADSLPLKWGKHLCGSARIGNNRVDFADRADKSGAYIAEFAGIRDNNDLLGMLQHLSVNKCLVGFQRGRAALSIETGNAEKNPISI